jgi:hypothetical protein
VWRTGSLSFEVLAGRSCDLVCDVSIGSQEFPPCSGRNTGTVNVAALRLSAW